jgi:hypothetical protein
VNVCRQGRSFCGILRTSLLLVGPLYIIFTLFMSFVWTLLIIYAKYHVVDCMAVLRALNVFSEDSRLVTQAVHKYRLGH